MSLRPEHDNSDPAFPTPPGGYGNFSGMSLRDYFAAAALQGMLAACTPETRFDGSIPAYAFKYADEMLKLR